MKDVVYICTVGTGTAGRDSLVASGIAHAIRQRRPRWYYLLPSSSPDSVGVAELVAEDVRDLPSQRGSLEPRHCGRLSGWDDLLACRRDVAAFIEAIRKQHPEAEIIINPTSGTKQMTTGAVLAALDAGIGRIDYVTGPRRDGVVMTGRECLTEISGRSVLAGITGRNGVMLMKSGAFHPAELILADYADLLPTCHALAATLARWDRFDYHGALQVAANREAPSWSRVRTALDKLARAGARSLEHGADMFCFAERCLRHARVEEALASLYRLVELLAKRRLEELGECPDDLKLNSALANPSLDVSGTVKTKLRAMAAHDRGIALGLKLSLELLKATDSPLVSMLYEDAVSWKTLQLRNDTRYGHGREFVDRKLVEALARRVRAAAAQQWPDFPRLIAAFRFPDVETMTEEEIHRA